MHFFFLLDLVGDVQWVIFKITVAENVRHIHSICVQDKEESQNDGGYELRFRSHKFRNRICLFKLYRIANTYIYIYFDL